jgi:hypothetical protein
MYRSVFTVNADKARKIYSATGQNIVWAVLATGIDGQHPHFRKHRNLELPAPLVHRDFTGVEEESPLTDGYGLGTHVAGIIAGELTSDAGEILASVSVYDVSGQKTDGEVNLESIAGMAPECKLLSMKVLDEKGHGNVSSVIAALDAIQQFNSYGRRILIHGVMISMGSDYDPQRFACGLSPLCVEVERLVRSGVVVVASAGNSGYGMTQTKFTGVTTAGLEVSINDPGNAELAITVGSTHREMPQLYGVSYFSSKGPTIDGRIKPDLVAPGEKIVSSWAAPHKGVKKNKAIHYNEDSGTHLASAHVSGVIAGFLSVRREYIGRPELVKQIFLASATDLQRSPFYQGKGLIDAFKAVQYEGLPAFSSHVSSALQPEIRLGLRDSAPVSPPPVVNSSKVDEIKRPLQVMCSYAHEDEAIWAELKAHLASLKRQGLIEIWYDRSILPGDQWRDEIGKNLEQSDIILLLVSSYFMDSDYCYDIEMKRAVERHDAGRAAVVPIIIRPVDWTPAPFSKLQALPRDAKAVTKWEDQHDAWENVAQGLRKVVEKLNADRK